MLPGADVLPGKGYLRYPVQMCFPGKVYYVIL
jgi:hypothetical protein